MELFDAKYHIQKNWLHPAYGSGEDWNLHDGIFVLRLRVWLHPAYGSGEDWNIHVSPLLAPGNRLHPAYGSGEDWNARM